MSYKFLDKLERRYGRYAIPYVTETIILVQVIAYFAVLSAGSPADQNAIFMKLVLVGEFVKGGEWYRLLSFLAVPPATGPLWAFFGWYLFWLYGRGLDQSWGTLKYNIYLLIAYLATIVVAFFYPVYPLENYYIGLTVFFAFAVLYPDFELLLFFVLPVKVKYLAWIGWAFLLYQFITADDQATRWVIQASILNFMLFFGKDIANRLKGMKMSADRKRERVQAAGQPFHTCAVCGKTDKSDPEEEFRYCPECHGSPGFCSEHIFNHEHITVPAPGNRPAPGNQAASGNQAGPDDAHARADRPKREKW